MAEALPKPDRERLMAHIGEFARRVKLSGTAEELESFRYLQAQMDAYGYRTTLLSHDAFISLPRAAKVEIDGNEEYRAVSIDRTPWANANRVRQVFREACARAGLRYYNPHSIRKTLVQLAYDLGLGAEAFKAWSQNLGHENCLTTFSSYGTISPTRQAEIIRNLGRRPTERTTAAPPPEVVQWLARFTRGDAAAG